MNIETLRQYRIGDYAIFDFVLAFVGMALLSPFLSALFLKLRIRIPFISWIFFTIPIGLLAHILVGNITPMTESFIDFHSGYILKIVIVALILLGFKGISIVK